jgi:predicted SAM-dependent methyltransferase
VGQGSMKLRLIGMAKGAVEKGFAALGFEIRRKMKEAPLQLGEGQNLAGDTRRIHYACGFRMFGGWLNVDGDLFLKRQEGFDWLELNLLSPHPFPDNWFEYGFCEDFLEHLSQGESIIFLSEVYRTFSEGGVLRLSFPGWEGVLKKHYGHSDYATAVKGRDEAYIQFGHIHFYAREEFSLLCRHLGFREVTFEAHGTSVHGPLQGLDYREDQINLNTYVEITK